MGHMYILKNCCNYLVTAYLLVGCFVDLSSEMRTCVYKGDYLNLTILVFILKCAANSSAYILEFFETVYGKC